jgi:hypothetical protein
LFGNQAAADDAAVGSHVDADTERADGLKAGTRSVAQMASVPWFGSAGRLVAARVHDLEVVDDPSGSSKTPSPSTSYGPAGRRS